MSKENENINQHPQNNIFEKFYFRQKEQLKNSKNTTKSKISQSLASSQISSNTNDINVESSNYFSECFNNSVIPYLSLNEAKLSRSNNNKINGVSLAIEF